MITQPAPPKVTLRLVIYGRVQGVYFRDSMRREAQRLAIAGWVRNHSGGMVEAVVHGEASDVEVIVSWAKRGPELAQVERVEIMPEEGVYASFEIV